jgi:hypothetical protein
MLNGRFTEVTRIFMVHRGRSVEIHEDPGEVWGYQRKIKEIHNGRFRDIQGDLRGIMSPTE